MSKSITQLIASHPLFSTMKPPYRQVLADHAEVISPEAGHYLLVAGKPADCFYVIESGVISVEQATSDGDATEVERLGANEVVGWSWMIPPFEWQFDALVIQTGRVWRFDAATLRAAADEQPGFGFELTLRITQSLVHRLQNTRIRLIEEAAR